LKVISFVNQKGGAGKSMLAINLAVAAEISGEKVCIVDLDKQGTVANWFNIRTSETPLVIAPNVAPSAVIHLRVGDLIAKLAGEGFSLIVIDTKGEESHDTRDAMKAADLCLIPLRPAGPDLHAIRPTVVALRVLGRKFALVVNQALPNKKSKLTAALMTALAHDGLVVPLAVAARASFQKSYSMGQAVMEFEGEGGPGAEEIKELWAWCRKHLADETEVRDVAAG
jgi:chromosome partitioning protein